jgi:pteridine reductase
MPVGNHFICLPSFNLHQGRPPPSSVLRETVLQTPTVLIQCRLMNETALQGKTALITGAAQRLGRAMSLTLADHGADIVVHYHHSEQQARQLAGEIQSLGRHCTTIPADLSDPEQLQTLFAKAVVQAGPIDILINSASVFDTETVWETTERSLHTNMTLHAYAALEVSRQFAGQNRPGHIVNMLDSRIQDYDKKHVAYHLSKRTLHSLTRILALELAPGIQVNAIAPGLILPPPGQDDQYLINLTHTNPLQRHGGPADITEALLFLVQSRFITGQILYIDGGRHLKGRTYE